MMNKEDIKARLVFLAKEKVRITNNRKAQEKIKNKKVIERSNILNEIKAAKNGIAKDINMLCDIEGEQRALFCFLTPEEKETVMEALKPFRIERHK